MHLLTRLLRRLLLCLLLGSSPGLPLAPPVAASAQADGLVGAVGTTPEREGVWPLLPRPEIVSGFEPPLRAWGAGHRGVDLLGHRGQRVRTALAGTVTFAARLAGRGVVVVDHGEVRTTYEPVSAGVRVGQRLGRGEVIGALQRVSSHCFPRACLHWGMLRGETYLDPLTLVGAGPVRLLPLQIHGSVGAGTALLGRSPWPLVGQVEPAPATIRPSGARAGRPDAADPM